ncbi:MAG: hypothetical protein J6C38_07670 [Oscillospiraceae bacterium]|nr:hypothetical protein [Oscillospiraceae bacterium]
MIKKVSQSVLAFVLVIVCQFVSISAYATDNTFNPLYSGVLRATDDVYMTISSSDAVMTNVIYPVSSTSNRFLTISDANTFTFSNEKFLATYTHSGDYTDLEGNVIGHSPDYVMIQTTEVHPTYFMGIFFQGVYIEYNGCRYNS